ncbi:MAG TPA: VWA domain-containing protein [Pseudomonadota bacterium]|nr:VWA domain-containing protein [Pseudomonadota bacterium]
MLDRLHEFTALLRRNGVRTSIAEVLDAVRALEACGLSERETVRGALSATLIKRQEDQPAFDELFDLFFYQPGQILRQSEAPLVEALRRQGLSEDELERLLALIADQATRLDPTARMALGLRRNDLEMLLRLSGIQVDFARLANPLQIGYFTQRVLEQLRFSDAQAQITQLGSAISAGFGGGRGGQVMELIESNLNQIRTTARAYVRNEFDKRNLRYTEEMRRELLLEKPFAQMSQQELARLQAEVARLAEKLRTQASLRPKQRRRGRLDIRRTLRSALASGGMPFVLRLRHRRVEKPRLCILCDISDSVRQVSRFMLQFVYTLQEMFSKVRSFVFVSDLGEATDLFARHDLDSAVQRALSGSVINVYANSNYGRALRQFVDRSLEAVTSRTTVIIIGDGRSNYFPPETWTLERIRGRARHVLWLNPETPASWMFGDSAMREYQPHTSRVEVVYNLATLSRVVDQLVL